jgi:hypothetical protein
MQRIMESFGELRDANLDIDESINKSLGTRYAKYLSVEPANLGRKESSEKAQWIHAGERKAITCGARRSRFH